MNDGLFKRNSQQREVILDELQKLYSHPTATILYEAVRKRLPKISLGTVYRNLELLAKKGMIKKLEVGGSEARFDGNLDKHYHISCTECGRIDDVHNLNYNDIKVDFSGLKGYHVQGYHMNFYGICMDCQQKGNTN